MKNKFFLYYHTLKRLTFSQILWRLIYIFKRKYIEKHSNSIFQKYKTKYIPNKVFYDNEGFTLNNRKFYRGNIYDVLENKMTFLNHTIDFGDNVIWDLPELQKGTRLWKLSINYHEYLVDIARHYLKSKDEKVLAWFENHIEEWKKQNPLGTKDYGKDNWNSYAISLRIVSWIRIYVLLNNYLSEDFKKDFLHWLKIQSFFLADNIEYDIIGNHIIKNYKALVWTSIFFNDTELSTKANIILKKYVLPQIKKDGMHEELSPMYTAIIIEDFLDCIAVNPKLENLKQICKKMMEKNSLLYFNNSWAFFNDSADGMAPTPDELGYYYNCLIEEPLPKETKYFNLGCYCGEKTEKFHWIADVENVVLGTQPGHVHADALSFELSYKGQKIFTNSGVFEYNSGEKRKYSRSSMAHNTLSVSEHEQHELWGSFRCGRMGKNTLVKFINKNVRTFLKAIFTNYDNFYTHTRKIFRIKNSMIFKDYLEIKNKKDARIYFHLTPLFKFIKINDTTFEITDNTKKIAILTTTGNNNIVKETPFFQAYGKEEKKDTLIIDIEDKPIITRINFYE